MLGERPNHNPVRMHHPGAPFPMPIEYITAINRFRSAFWSQGPRGNDVWKSAKNIFLRFLVV